MVSVGYSSSGSRERFILCKVTDLGMGYITLAAVIVCLSSMTEGLWVGLSTKRPFLVEVRLSDDAIK